MAKKKKYSKKETIYFQTLIVTFEHPETGKETTRRFVGKALFTPEVLDEMIEADMEMPDILYLENMERPFKIEIDGEDERSVEIHQKLVEIERKRMQQEGN